MPTTKELVAIELIPGKNHINCKYKTTVTNDGVVLSTKDEGKSYIGDARFSIEIAPTGASLSAIVASLNTAALTERDEALLTLTAAQSALATANSALLAEQAAHEATKALLAAATAVPPAPVLSMTEQIVAAMTALFDSTAQARRYDNRITCALRAGYAGPFHAEGVAFATWMDTCNALGYTMLAEVQAGVRQMPATVEEALALLPPMVWPV